MPGFLHDIPFASAIVGRNKLAQFRQASERTISLRFVPELRKLVPAYIYLPTNTSGCHRETNRNSTNLPSRARPQRRLMLNRGAKTPLRGASMASVRSFAV